MFGFGKNKKQKAVEAACHFIQALFGPYTRTTSLANIVRTDPYVCGFLAARMPGVAALASSELGLSQQDAQEVAAMTMLKVFGDSTTAGEILKLANSLRQESHEQFMLGNDRGGRAMSYITRHKDITNDPDYPEAIKLANEEMGMNKLTDIWSQLAGLDQVWLRQHMRRYL